MPKYIVHIEVSVKIEAVDAITAIAIAHNELVGTNFKVVDTWADNVLPSEEKPDGQ